MKRNKQIQDSTPQTPVQNKQGYPDFSTWQWVSYDGKQKADIKEFMAKYSDRDFYVGTDSQNYKNKRNCVFTTVLIAYKRGHGGTIIRHSDKTAYVEHLRQRLIIEAMRSLETAWYIDSICNKQSVVTIHLDVNENRKYKSSQYCQELVGLVMAQGYNCTHKPNSWAASTCADAKT